jgi:hypothetical protein
LTRMQPWVLVLLLAISCGDDGDAVVPDARIADARVPDAAVPDAAVPDAAPPANACLPSKLPMNRPDPMACCLVGDDEWFVAGNGNLVHRHLATACTLEDGVTGGCAGMQCLHGPCGARILETFPPPAYVFRPMSDPSVCGRQGTGLAGTPEAWTAAHELYPPATTACPYTDCTATGPVVKLAVTTTAASATGRVTSTPAGLDLSGAGTATAAFPTLDITLEATPTGEHARAVFSGACAATGVYGQPATCRVTLGPDKAVAVTFECEQGQTCPL